MPPGVQPPIIPALHRGQRADRADEPASDKMSESDVYDYGIFRIRTPDRRGQRITLPTPNGGNRAHRDGRSRPAGLAGERVEPRAM